MLDESATPCVQEYRNSKKGKREIPNLHFIALHVNGYKGIKKRLGFLQENKTRVAFPIRSSSETKPQ